MSTERNSVFELDDCPDITELMGRFGQETEAPRPLLRLSASVAAWDRVKALMPELRASNTAVCLLLKKGEPEVSDELMTEIFANLRLWDQFTLHNLLELCGQWFSPVQLTPIRQEARMEMKWFEEWSTAASDNRIHKYPNLPWRRFIRKMNTENYLFFTQVLAQWGVAGEDEESRVAQVVGVFLKEKRKAVNIAPKRFKDSPKKEGESH